MSTTDDLARLAAVIESRKPAAGGDPSASYVAKLLAKDPDDRYASASQLAESLSVASATIPGAAPPSEPKSTDANVT